MNAHFLTMKINVALKELGVISSPNLFSMLCNEAYGLMQDLVSYHRIGPGKPCRETLYYWRLIFFGAFFAAYHCGQVATPGVGFVTGTGPARGSARRTRRELW
jgi:hypothetical protein